MLDTFRQLRYSVIFLVLVVFSFGVGDEASLCLMPDGHVHLERNHHACSPAVEHAPGTDSHAVHDGQVQSRAHCLDVSLGKEASTRQHRGMDEVPSPAALSLAPPRILAVSVNTAPRIISPLPPQQLLSLRSTVLLI